MDDAERYWSPLFEVTRERRCWVRIAWREGSLTEEGEWGQLLLIPTPGYLEGSDGPIPLRDVEWIDVSMRRIKGGMAGRPLERIDITDEVLASLQDTHLDWELVDVLWSIERLFENEPVQVVRLINPFGLPVRK